MIGAHLIEFEQDDAHRAAYGAGFLARLSRDLREHQVKGVSPKATERMRLLYLLYPQLRMHISAMMTRNLPGPFGFQQSVSISAPLARKSKASDPTSLLSASEPHLIRIKIHGGQSEVRTRRAFERSEFLADLRAIMPSCAVFFQRSLHVDI